MPWRHAKRLFSSEIYCALLAINLQRSLSRQKPPPGRNFVSYPPSRSSTGVGEAKGGPRVVCSRRADFNRELEPGVSGVWGVI